MADKAEGITQKITRWLTSHTRTEETSAISKIDMDRYKKELQKKGVAGVKEQLSKDLHNWTNVELNTAVTGNSGTGKSSFINSIRGLKPSDPGAAKVGTSQTTNDCQSYKHPENKSFLVWDLPGVGTPRFKKKTYLDQVDYNKYDFFIIMSRNRFTENDQWLAKEIQKQEKKFFFVRSHIDADVRNDKEDHPEDHNEEDLIDKIRKETEDELSNSGIREPKVFLISNRASARDIYDYGKLNNELLASCEGLKKDAMALSLLAITKSVMAEKKKVLQGRIHKTAIVVVNLTSDYEQKNEFKNEIHLYQKQFDIDNATLSENKEILSLTDRSIQQFKVVFDKWSSGEEMQVKTPTAMRQEGSTWERFKDWFRWSDENKLLYNYCVCALSSNLDTMYELACELYDLKRTTHMVHAISK